MNEEQVDRALRALPVEEHAELFEATRRQAIEVLANTRPPSWMDVLWTRGLEPACLGISALIEIGWVATVIGGMMAT